MYILNDKKNVYHVNEGRERRRLSYAFQYVICVIFDSVAPRVADNYIIYNFESLFAAENIPKYYQKTKIEVKKL